MVKELGDYVDQIQERFPFVCKSDIYKILRFGLIKYAWANKMHADVNILYRGKRYNETALSSLCGRLGWDRLVQYHRFCNKSRMKERVLFFMNKQKWDGYYYIGLTQQQLDNLKKKSKKIVFGDVYLCKLKRELYHLPYVKHIWRVPYTDDMGWKFKITNFSSAHAEYIGKSPYEKYHQCYLGRYIDRYPSIDDAENSSQKCIECNSDNV